MRVCIYFFTVFIFSFRCSLCFSGNSKADSLERVLKSSREDTVKVNLLNMLSAVCESYDIDKSLFYANEALSLSQKLNYESGKAWAYSNIGNYYWYTGNYVRTSEYYLRSLKIYEQQNDSSGIASSYRDIGWLYVMQNNHDAALENYFKAVKITEARKEERFLGILYNDIGVAYKSQKKYNLALEYQQKSLQIKEKRKDKEGTATSYGNMGILYQEKGEYDLAVEYLSNALKLYEELGDRNYLIAAYNNLGLAYEAQGKPKLSIQYQEKTLKLSLEVGHKEGISAAYDALASAYSSLGNFKEAYEFHKKYSDIKDSILNEESSKQITEMQAKYETEKKEQQITLLNKDKELQNAQLNRQKIIIWSVAGGLLVVLILSIFIFRERKKSEKLLLNILPAETAKELKRKGKAIPKHYESVTVMFTDFKGFTTIAEKLSAEELVSELDFLFKKFDEIISRYNIEKIKTIGDAYMCASGLPTPNSNHAENIVNAAIEIQTWMHLQNNQWMLRVGVHTGPVTAGVVGDKKFAYDIWGDTVNTASRMESSGEPNKINISGTTHELIKDKFKCEFRGKIPAKNKGEIEMFFV